MDMNADGVFNAETWESLGASLAPEFKEFDLVNPHNFPSYIWAAEAKARLGDRCPPVVWYCEEPPRHLHWAITDVHGVGRYP
ncbi:MAG: hypothetical protein ACM3ZU_00025 [Bacteroidota bacterium]